MDDETKKAMCDNGWGHEVGIIESLQAENQRQAERIATLESDAFQSSEAYRRLERLCAEKTAKNVVLKNEVKHLRRRAGQAHGLHQISQRGGAKTEDAR